MVSTEVATSLKRAICDYHALRLLVGEENGTMFFRVIWADAYDDDCGRVK